MVAQTFRPDRFPVVEEPDLVRTVVGAVTCPNTAVIDLNIQAFVVVVGGEYRAHRLAGSVFTVLAHDWNKPRLHVREFAFPISFDADPFVSPPLQEQVLGIDGQVIFRLTCDDAGLTTGAPVQIYYHAPFVIYPLCNHFSLQLSAISRRS